MARFDKGGDESDKSYIPSSVFNDGGGNFRVSGVDEDIVLVMSICQYFFLVDVDARLLPPIWQVALILIRATERNDRQKYTDKHIIQIERIPQKIQNLKKQFQQFFKQGTNPQYLDDDFDDDKQQLSVVIKGCVEFLIGHFTVFGQEGHLEVDLLRGDVGVGHDDPPVVVREEGFRVSHQHFPLIDHVLLRQHRHLAQHRVELLLAGEVCLFQFLGHVPEADAEGFHILDGQLELGVTDYVLTGVKGEAVLLLDLPSNAVPAVALEVGPQLEDVDDPPTLQVLVSHVEHAIVGGTLLVEEVVGFGAVRVGHESGVPAEEEGGLHRDHQCLVRVEGYGVHVGKGSDVLDQLLAHHEGTTEGRIHVVPDPVASTDLADLSDRVNTALHRCPYRRVHHHDFVTCLQFPLYRLFQLGSDHPATIVGLDVDNAVGAGSDEDHALLERVVADFRSEDLHGLLAVEPLGVDFGVGFETSHLQAHKVGEGAPGGHRAVDFLPPDQAPYVVVDVILHQRVARRDLVCKDRAVDRWDHHCSYERVLVETSEELVVEVRVVGLDLVVQDCLAGLEQLLLGAGLGGDLEVYDGGELMRQLEVDHLVLSLQGLLQKALDQIERLAYKAPVIIWVDFCLFHQSINKLLSLLLIDISINKPVFEAALSSQSLRQQSALEAEDKRAHMGSDLYGSQRPRVCLFS